MAIEKQNEFLKMDENMITIFNIKQDASRKSRGEEVNLFVFICSELSKAIAAAKEHKEDLTRFILEVPYSEIHQILFNRPVSGETVTVKNLMDVVNKIHNLEGVTMMIYQDAKSKEKSILYDHMQIYSRIQIEGQAKHYDKAVFKVKLTEDFIEYYKEVFSRRRDYFKLELDIAFSLTTKNSKIVYAYLSRYHDQMNKHSSTNKTGIASKDGIMFYLDDKKYQDDNGEWVYKMSIDQLKKIISNALKDINEVIKMKREKYGIDIPTYDIEYFQLDPKATRGPKTRINHFRFFYVDEGKKVDVNRLHYKKKDSYEEVICEFSNDEDIREMLRDFIKDSIEAENYISVESFKTQLNSLSDLDKGQLMEYIRELILVGNHRSFGYKVKE